MLNHQQIIIEGRRTVAVEAAALEDLGRRLGDDFARAVEMLAACTGKVVVTGVGKSGIICRKIAATLASTGTPALFLHPTEGLHGDLGVLSSQDLVIAISYSGTTEELIKIIPALKRQGLPLLVLTGNLTTELAKSSDLVLDISINREACPLGLAPTASTTVTLALGDALASALLAVKGFSADDFALRHPGGALGRRLLLRVADIMHSGSRIPLVSDLVSLKEALFEMTGKGLGVTGIKDDRGVLVGILTDGDLRRLLSEYKNPFDLPVAELMTCKPKSIMSDELAATALKKMEDSRITSLFVMAEESSEVNGLSPVGIIHLHDLLRAGVV
ncbi:MAG: KpsF/GutQ family sugar-phosphate isomerase [Deltaproteobacteria bacterium]|nr:KpsF/GutQ family sugar-phosphate isomerase [Deltaproteobacteria bacterium]